MRTRHCIKIETQTWASDSHDLFDYEAGNIYCRDFKVDTLKDSYCIIRDGCQIHVIPEDEASPYKLEHPNSVILLRLCRREDTYYMLPSFLPSVDFLESEYGKRNCTSSERLWLVVRSMKQGVSLCAGDTVKLGRFQLKVKQVVTTAEQAWQSEARMIVQPEDDCETVAPDGDSNGEGNEEEVLVEEAIINDMVSNVSSLQTSRERARRNDLLFSNSSVIDREVVVHNDDTRELSRSNSHAAITQMLEANSKNSENNGQKFQSQSKCAEFCSGSSASKNYDNSKNVESTPRVIGSNDSSALYQRNNAGVCRICYCVGEKNNPLISPCKCKGTMQYVHLSCLRAWMEERLNIHSTREGAAVSFFWRTLDCELCNTTYPLYVSACGERVELLRIPRPNYPYIVIEPKLQRDRGLHVICLANRNLARLGRGHDSDVRFSDISVSRLHAILKFQKGEIILEDNSSKFGTLLEIREACKVENGSTRTLQVGRTHVTITIKRKWNLFPPCLQGAFQMERDVVSADTSTGAF